MVGADRVTCGFISSWLGAPPDDTVVAEAGAGRNVFGDDLGHDICHHVHVREKTFEGFESGEEAGVRSAAPVGGGEAAEATRLQPTSRECPQLSLTK